MTATAGTAPIAEYATLARLMPGASDSAQISHSGALAINPRYEAAQGAAGHLADGVDPVTVAGPGRAKVAARAVSTEVTVVRTAVT